MTNIEDLKQHLGRGLGTKKNKYLIEIPIPAFSQTLNILCKSASLPSRTITTVSTFHKGRKFNMRAETAYEDTYEITIIDDSNMNMRKIFDKWLTKVDNTVPKELRTQGASFEPSFLSNSSFGLNVADESIYFSDVNIWQLSNTGQRIYGYKLLKAFPTTIGETSLEDSSVDELSEFSLTFTYSELIPLVNPVYPVVNETGLFDLDEGIESLFS